MNIQDLVVRLLKLADNYEASGMFREADIVTNEMIRLSNVENEGMESPVFEEIKARLMSVLQEHPEIDLGEISGELIPAVSSFILEAYKRGDISLETLAKNHEKGEWLIQSVKDFRIGNHDPDMKRGIDEVAKEILHTKARDIASSIYHDIKSERTGVDPMTDWGYNPLESMGYQPSNPEEAMGE